MRHYQHIDFFRAILITLVILVHIVNFGDLYPAVKHSILAFMMPAFLLITGYLVNVNKPVKAFVLYIIKILLPYVIMVTGFALLSLYLPVRDGLDAFSLSAMVRVLFVTSIGPYWFLHTMMVCGIIYYVSFNVFDRLDVTAKYSIFASLLIVVALLTSLLNIKYAAYYFIGVGIKLYIKDFSRVYKSSLWPVIPFVLLISNPVFHDWGTLSIVICILCFLSFSAKFYDFCSSKVLKELTYIGRNTFPIYIFHPIFTMLSKWLLPVFSFDFTGLLHAFVTIVICILGSIGIGPAYGLYSFLLHLRAKKFVEVRCFNTKSDIP